MAALLLAAIALASPSLAGAQSIARQYLDHGFVGVFAEHLNDGPMRLVQIPLAGRGTSVEHMIPRSAGAILPGCVAATRSGTVVLGGVTTDGGAVLSEMDLRSGRVVSRHSPPDLVIEVITAATGARAVLVNGFNVSSQANGVYTYENGRLTLTVPLPGLVVDLGTAVLCDGGDSLAFTARDDDSPGGVSLVRVALSRGGVVLGNVPLNMTVTMLMPGRRPSKLLAWGASEAHAGVLFELDLETGKAGPPLWSSTSLSPNDMSGAAAASDPVSQSVIAVLINITAPGPDGGGAPVRFDLSSSGGGKAVVGPAAWGFGLGIVPFVAGSDPELGPPSKKGTNRR